MPSAIRRLPIPLIVMLAVAAPAVADWRFDPRIGVGGEAYVFNLDGAKLSVECQGDGTPAVTLTPDPRPAGPRAGVETARFYVVFDGDAPVDFEARCYGVGDRTACVAEPGIWTAWELVDALRGRRQVEIAHEGGATVWSLAGSNRAIASLEGCLTP